jgi:uncharacterized protein YhfF
MKTNSVERFWEEFCALEPSVSTDTPHQTWYFGNTREMAVELADLVLSGRKTATASLLAMNELNPSDAPQPDGYSVITDFDGIPLCVLQTTEIRHLPFDEVDERFASDEGEGDLSYDHWRRVHWDYFSREAAINGFEFDGNSIVCCERFRVLYPR